MKKIFTFVLMSITIQVIGQNHYIGLKGGLSWANQTKYPESSDYRKGKTFALSYDYFFNKYVKMGTEINYNEHGSIYGLSIYGDRIEARNTKTEFNYISVPIKLGLTYGEKFCLFTDLGILVSYPVSLKATVSTEPYSLFDTYYESNEIKDRQNVITGLFVYDIGFGYKTKNALIYTSFEAHKNSFSYILMSNIGIKYALKKK